MADTVPSSAVEGAIDLLKVPGWDGFGWLRHGFSARAGGVSEVYGARSLNLGRTLEDDPARVDENRRRLVERVGGGHLRTLRQVHSDVVCVVGPDDKQLGEGDGLVTAEPGLLLGVLTADCVPVMLVDSRQRAVGVVHAGWRGTAAGIAQAGIARMLERLGSRAEDLWAAVGPSIGPCCYKVGEEVRRAFAARPEGVPGLFEGERLNLWEANRRQLVAAAVTSQRITVLAQCTSCSRTAEGDRRFFSHRAERGVTGRMLSVIGIASLPKWETAL